MDTVSSVKYNKDRILIDLVVLVEDMTSDWDMDSDVEIGPHTKLINDLEFESIDVVQLILAIEERYERKGMPFEKLIMRDGRYVDEIVLGEVIEFLHEELNKSVV